MQTEKAYRQLQLDCGMVPEGPEATGDSETIPKGRASPAELGMVSKAQVSTAEFEMTPEGQPSRSSSGMMPEGQPSRGSSGLKPKRLPSRSSCGMIPFGQASTGSCGKIRYCDKPVSSSCERDTFEKERDGRSIVTRGESDSYNRKSAKRYEGTFFPALQASSVSCDSPNNGNLSDSFQGHEDRTAVQMSVRCASQRVSETRNSRQEPEGKVDSASVRYDARCERNRAITRCSVHVGANRNCCSVWKNPYGSKTRLPKALRDLLRKQDTCTQTAMLSFSAPAQLDGASPVVSNGDCPSTAPPRNAKNPRRISPSSRPRRNIGVDDELPTYEEISRANLLSPASDPPPGYQELFGTLNPESLNWVRPGGGASLPRGPAARTFWKPQTTSRRKRRCCFGCLNDRECWILLIANCGFILIFILAAIYSK